MSQQIKVTRRLDASGAELVGFGGVGGGYPVITYYVAQASGKDGRDGLGWATALETFQAGITLAIQPANKYKDVDLIVGPGEYDEEATVGCSTTACQASSGDDWLGYKIGRFRIICMGKAVVFKNSGAGLDSTHTLNVLRMKTEIYGGTWRNYVNAGGFAAIHFERTNIGDYGDVINGKVVGAKLEARDSASIGIDLDSAQYVWIEDCVFSGWDTGVLIAGQTLGCVENVVKGCYFRNNTNDILLGQSQYTLLDSNIHMDGGTTLFVGASGISQRTGTVSDGFCVGARLNTTSINSGKFPVISGLAVADTHTHDR